MGKGEVPMLNHHDMKKYELSRPDKTVKKLVIPSLFAQILLT
jgi:hypothetical protein